MNEKYTEIFEMIGRIRRFTDEIPFCSMCPFRDKNNICIFKDCPSNWEEWKAKNYPIK